MTTSISISAEEVTIYIGNIIHCSRPFQVETFEKGYIATQRCKIIAIDDVTTLDDFVKSHKTAKKVELTDSQILIPGLIDTHIHASQYPNIGLGYDKPLLEWLNTYTFPLESKYKDSEFAEKAYNGIVRKTLHHGTTTACYFATLFGDTSLILANSAIAQGQRAFIGKVNMTRLAPSDYVETPEELVTNTKQFVENILGRNNNLVKPIVTPRFALSLNMDEMKILGNIAREYNIPIQTHVSENEDEVKEVEKIFNKSYAEVYEEANLLTENTILAHAVHLHPEEITLIKNRGTAISHCPSSNINLKSGLCNVKKLIKEGIKVGLGTDVSGGRSISIVDAMKSSIDTSLAISFNQTDKDNVLTYSEAFYLGTLGGAKALNVDNVTGNFELGKDFDALLVDMDVVDGNSDYLQSLSPLELLQKFIYVGDDRNILSVFVAGRKVK